MNVATTSRATYNYEPCLQSTVGTNSTTNKAMVANAHWCNAHGNQCTVGGSSFSKEMMEKGGADLQSGALDFVKTELLHMCAATSLTSFGTPTYFCVLADTQLCCFRPKNLTSTYFVGEKCLVDLAVVNPTKRFGDADGSLWVRTAYNARSMCVCLPRGQKHGQAGDSAVDTANPTLPPLLDRNGSDHSTPGFAEMSMMGSYVFGAALLHWPKRAFGKNVLAAALFSVLRCSICVLPQASALNDLNIKSGGSSAAIDGGKVESKKSQGAAARLLTTNETPTPTTNGVPSPSPTTAPVDLVSLISGLCTLSNNGNCMLSPNYPSDYGVSQNCEVSFAEICIALPNTILLF
jgi:hypothetical protein